MRKQTCRKPILSDNEKAWVKSHIDNFDVPISAYDWAQIADLIGISILDTLGRIINLNHIGLYRDDSFIFKPNSNSSKTSKIH